MVVEDDLDALPIEDAVDRSERDRRRVRDGGREAARAVAAGSSFFKHSRLASQARWSKQLTPYDGLIAFSPRDAVEAEVAAEVRRKLDPVSGLPFPPSRLATPSRCGFYTCCNTCSGWSRRASPRRRLTRWRRQRLPRWPSASCASPDRGAARRDTPETAPPLEVTDADALVAGSPPR
jgi:hypothetical protein